MAAKPVPSRPAPRLYLATPVVDDPSSHAASLPGLLAAADIAFARVNDVAGLARHPHLRRITVETPSGPVSYPAPAARSAAASRRYGKVPALGEHTARVRAEFMAAPVTAD